MSETLTDSMRRRLREVGNVCPTCGQATDESSVRGLAAAIGISHSTLWRFLKGKDMTGRNLDRVHAYLALATPAPSTEGERE